MTKSLYERRVETLTTRQRELFARTNEEDQDWDNGVFQRFRHPVLTASHVPLHWRYDFDPVANPNFQERLAVNAVFNSGAIEWEGKVALVVRIEGADRKSFFAVAQSENGVDNFTFADYPILIPDAEDPETNVYDMRLTKHEDGWIYGIFCVERLDPTAPPGDLSSALAQCAIVRTRDLEQWERLPDIRTASKQQRNIVLHPEFVGGRYMFYTRPQDEFMEAGTGMGICYGFCDRMENAVIEEQKLMDARAYHTVKELKNGPGAPPVKTPQGWLHIVHGVRNTAAGMRYVLYALLSDLNEPWRVIARPGGYFIAPEGEERIGDVSNVVFTNGMVVRDNNTVLIYYASSDTRLHVARSSVEHLLDYVRNTPEDPMRSRLCVEQRIALIRKNKGYMAQSPNPC